MNYKKVVFQEKEYKCLKEFYKNGRPCLSLYELRAEGYWEKYFEITLDFPEYNIDENCAFIDNYGVNRELYFKLIESGAIEETSKSIFYNFVIFPVVKILI